MPKGWRERLTEESSEGSGLLKQSRVIDAVPIDFMSGEVVERKGAPAQKFWGQLIYPSPLERFLLRSTKFCPGRSKYHQKVCRSVLSDFVLLR
jgi:hypothetical protein